jgi:hypothetical protein
MMSNPEPIEFYTGRDGEGHDYVVIRDAGKRGPGTYTVITIDDDGDFSTVERGASKRLIAAVQMARNSEPSP